MANTIKIKRGSGSDPAASDMVLGEPVLRTDTAELFFKKDDGSVAKVSGGGGGPDFKYLALRNAANNGAASYPNADFTLVTSGTTNAIVPTAANTLLVSVNGVIQKPNTGTSTPSSGFALSGSTIKFGANISAAPDFILYQESGGIGEPSDETVSEAKLKVSNSPVNGYFLSAQSGNTGGLTWAAPVATSCTGNSATATALATARAINGVNFDGTAAITVTAAAGTLSGTTLNSSVVTSSLTSLGDLTSLTVTGDLVVDTSTLKVDSSNNRVGIGTATPSTTLNVTGTAAQAGIFQSNQSATTISVLDTDGDGLNISGGSTYGHRIHTNNTEKLELGVNNSTKLVIDSTGNVGIGTTSPNVLGNDAQHTIFSVIETSGTRRGQIELGDNQNVDGGGIGDIHFVGHYQSGSHKDMACIKAVSSGSTSGKRGSYLAFETKTDNVDIAERMRINSSGSVLVGTTSDSIYNDTSGAGFNLKSHGQLVLAKEATSAADPLVWLNDTGQTTNKAIVFAQDGSEKANIGLDGDDATITVAGSERMRIKSSGVSVTGSVQPSGNIAFTSNNCQIQTGSSGHTLAIQGGATNMGGRIELRGGNTGGDIRMHAQGLTSIQVERMRITSAGNVGIGTTSPSRKLDVVGDAEFIHDNGVTIEATSTDTAGQLTIIGVNASNQVSAISRIKSVSTGSSTAATATTFSNRDASNNVNEHMRITSTGTVLIGTTSGGNTGSYFQADNNDRRTLNVASSSTATQNQIIFRNPNDRVGTIQTSGTSTSYNTTFSDIASKKNFENWTEDVLSLFKSVNPQKFNFKVEDDSASKSKGFIAQEMVDKFPEAYVKQEDEMYMFNPSGMVVYLMKALQEAVGRIEALEAK